MRAPTWKCKDGREILISDMGEHHLLNSIRLVIKSVHEKLKDVDPDDIPPHFTLLEIATYSVPTLRHLIYEADNRGYHWKMWWPLFIKNDGQVEKYLDFLKVEPAHKIPNKKKPVLSEPKRRFRLDI